MKYIVRGLMSQASFLLVLGGLYVICAWPGCGVEGLLQSHSTELTVDRLQDLIRQRRWDDASQAIRQLAQRVGDNPKLDYWEGVLNFQRGNPVGAIVAFRKAERQGLNTAGLHISLGLAYYLIHQYLLFQQQMGRAAQIAPSDDRPFYYLGRYLESARDNFTRALDLFNKALKLNPDNAEALYHQGYCLQMLGRAEEAEKSYQKAIALTENDGARFSWPYQGMAMLLLQKDPRRALGFARMAIKLGPGIASNHAVLARLDEQLGRPLDAIVELEKAVELDPTNPAPHYSLARLYRKTGDSHSAQAQLKLFEELNTVYGSQ